MLLSDKGVPLVHGGGGGGCVHVGGHIYPKSVKTPLGT